MTESTKQLLEAATEVCKWLEDYSEILQFTDLYLNLKSAIDAVKKDGE